MVLGKRKQEVDLTQDQLRTETKRREQESLLVLERERSLWKEQQEMILETKQKGLELEKQTRHQNAKLPKLTTTPFRGTSKDWIRFWNQVENQLTNKTVKFGYLLELIDERSKAVIGKIPNTDERYDRARETLCKEFGQERSVINTHKKEIIEMTTVHGTRYNKVKDFYDNLSINYEALRAMAPEGKVEGLVLSTLETLPQVKPDVTRDDEEWEAWDCTTLLEEVRKLLKRHKCEETINTRKPEKGSRTFMIRDDERRESRGPRCFYCPRRHWPDQCEEVKDVKRRKEILREKGLCYKCGENRFVKNCERSCWGFFVKGTTTQAFARTEAKEILQDTQHLGVHAASGTNEHQRV